MYLMINGTKHTVSRRILTGDTVKYLSVTPEPVNVSGLISMYRDDGFLLCADDAAGYERTVYNGTILTLTNAPEPEPQPPSAEDRLGLLEEALAQTDETAIALFESQAAQESIDAQQDDALLDIYEMLGG